MAEWSIAAVLKTVEVRASGGSNPSLSAKKGVNQVVTRFTPFFTPQRNQGWVKIFEIFKINADEKRRSTVFLFSSASLLCYRSKNKFSSLWDSLSKSVYAFPFSSSLQIYLFLIK